MVNAFKNIHNTDPLIIQMKIIFIYVSSDTVKCEHV